VYPSRLGFNPFSSNFQLVLPPFCLGKFSLAQSRPCVVIFAPSDPQGGQISCFGGPFQDLLHILLFFFLSVTSHAWRQARLAHLAKMAARQVTPAEVSDMLEVSSVRATYRQRILHLKAVLHHMELANQDSSVLLREMTRLEAMCCQLTAELEGFRKHPWFH